MNYSSLVQAIKDYTENNETTFVNQIDEFINQAELRILFDIDLPYFRKNSTGTTTASNSYLGKPSDFLSSHSLAVMVKSSAPARSNRMVSSSSPPSSTCI